MRRSCLLWQIKLLAFVALLLPVNLHAATGCGLIKPDSTDAVAAAPDHHKVILENDAVRVLEARVPFTATNRLTRIPGPVYSSNKPLDSVSLGKPSTSGGPREDPARDSRAAIATGTIC